MSDLTKAAQSGYRPIGNHRYGIKLIVSLAALVLLLTLLDKLLDTLPDRDALVDWGFALLPILGICESAWMIFKPERSRASLDAGQSLRTIRFRASLLLLAWVAVLTFVIQNLF